MSFEFFVSLNIALAVIWEKSTLSPFSLEMHLQYRINGYLHLHPHSNVGGFMVMFGLALGLALCIVLVLRLLSGTLVVKEFLRSFAGIISLIAMPASWLYVNYALEHLPIPAAPGIQELSLYWPLFESAVAVVCAMLFLYGKWPIPPWGSIVLLGLHWCFWGWRLFGPFFWARPPFLIFPIVGFCSSLIWGLYVSSQPAPILHGNRV